MTCCRCHRPLSHDERVLVGVPFSNSGAGGPACYACLGCARYLTRLAMAPDWVTEEIAKTEERVSGHRDPP